jgi:transposase
VWSVLHEPTAQDEDARRTHREQARLAHERTAHTNRIGSWLVLYNLRPNIIIGGRDWSRWWDKHCEEVPPVLRSEIERQNARLALVKQQVKAMEALRRQKIADGKQPLVVQLIKLRAIGPKDAWVLVKELFGWRRFANRRELAGYLGQAPTPYASGDNQFDQDISKAGKKRARALLVELSWGWLRLQPDCSLSQWFNRRFATAGIRRADSQNG